MRRLSAQQFLDYFQVLGFYFVDLDHGGQVVDFGDCHDHADGAVVGPGLGVIVQDVDDRAFL